MILSDFGTLTVKSTGDGAGKKFHGLTCLPLINAMQVKNHVFLWDTLKQFLLFFSFLFFFFFFSFFVSNIFVQETIRKNVTSYKTTKKKPEQKTYLCCMYLMKIYSDQSI